MALPLLESGIVMVRTRDKTTSRRGWREDKSAFEVLYAFELSAKCLYRRRGS